MSKHPQENIPQPHPLPVLGNVLEIGGEGPVDSFGRLAKRHGPIYKLTFPKDSLYVISSHKLAAELCDEKRFSKKVHRPLKELQVAAGNGLFTAESDDPEWERAHKILTPAFGMGSMLDYFEPMLDIAQQLVERWERFGEQHAYDAPAEMTNLTLDTIALAAFDYRLNSFYRESAHPFVEAMVRVLKEGSARGRRPDLLNALLVPKRLQLVEDVDIMHELTSRLVEQRRAHMDADEETPNDLLMRLLTAQGDSLSDENIRYQLLTFLIAGHETTSGLLSYAIYRLLEHDEVRAKAIAEVDEVLGRRTPSFEDLAKLEYIEQLLKETLRLHPTAPAFAVQPRQDTVIGGCYPVKQGDSLLIHLPTLHRDPAAWPDPERFDPERFAKGAAPIPRFAWMPFGNGKRACIGRIFAMQEAKLVLAMLLQRFELTHVAPYKLTNVETLTIKPADLLIHARLRRDVPPVEGLSKPTRKAKAPAQAQQVEGHQTPLLVLYGSNAGSAESLARRVAGDGVARGWRATIAPLDDHVAKLPTQGAVIIVAASYNGEPTDNAVDFLSWVDTLEADQLKGVHYAVLGCGHRDWASTYQAIPRKIDERLAASGAARLLTRGECDAGADFFGGFEAWYAPLWSKTEEALGVEAQAGEQGARYEVEVIPAPSQALIQRQELRLATVLECRELVEMSAIGARSKRHLELALPSGMTYAAGDYLAVLPENPPELPKRLAKRLGLDLDATIKINDLRGLGSNLPLEQLVSLREVLSRFVELSAPASRGDINALASHNPCPPHRDQLLALAADDVTYREQILEPRVTILELLERFPTCAPPLGVVLDLLPAMKQRMYSIASSPKVQPEQVALTVALVSYESTAATGHRVGVASSYLATRQPGDRVAVAVRPPKRGFCPPKEDSTPMIMIAAGSGIAPFRGFVQDRAASKAAGHEVAPALLFFGCDHPEVDLLYAQEWAQWQEEGIVTLLPAFSAQPDGEVMFVQHKLWQQRERVSKLLEDGAHVYVCGDGAKMAPAAREVIQKIGASLQPQPQDGGAWIDELERQGRYVADVFG